MNPNKELWEKGDFTRIAASMRVSGEEIVSELRITSESSVLDLGCGDGTTALPAATLGATVLGVDIAENLVQSGNQRAAEAGLANLHFQTGDAAHLSDLANDTFDLTLTIFGAMFASRPSEVAKEMVRVTRPGGRIVMGNWIPNDSTLVAQLLRISSAYTALPPAGFISPMSWGDQDTVIHRFDEAGVPAERIEFSRETFTFRSPSPPVDLLATFRSYYGPTMNAYAAAEASGNADMLDKELRELFELCNTTPGTGTTVIPSTYLRVSVAV